MDPRRQTQAQKPQQMSRCVYYRRRVQRLHYNLIYLIMRGGRTSGSESFYGSHKKWKNFICDYKRALWKTQHETFESTFSLFPGKDNYKCSQIRSRVPVLISCRV